MEALGDGEYATLIEALRGHGYQQRRELRRFQLVREVPAEDGGVPIDIIVDFLMPRDAEIVKNVPPLIESRGNPRHSCRGRIARTAKPSWNFDFQ